MDNLACTMAIYSDFFNAFAALPRHEQGKVADFVTKFCNNPSSPGINYEKIHSASDSKFRSVRIDDSYRGIILKPDEGNVYLLLWVDRHDKAYDWARKKHCIINPSRGNIQIYDKEEHPAATDHVEANSGIGLADRVISLPRHQTAGLFDDVDDDTIKKIGVPDELMTLVRGIRSQEELDAKARLVPQDVYEALCFIASGITPEEVLRELFADDTSVAAGVDTGDFAAALDKPGSKEKFMVLDGEDGEQELKEMLAAPLEKWRVFLHPSQRRMVEKNYTGPAQTLGGAGTGKTVVAMHRARWLAQNIFQSPDDRILFTTFTVNLAGDIRDNLKKICTPEILNRIEVVNLDKWVTDFLKTQGYKYEIVYGARLNALWQEALAVAPLEPAMPPSFYREEWDKIVIPQEIRSINDYIKSSRLGRGVRLDRKARAAIWKVFEQLECLMNDQGVRDAETAMMDARVLLQDKGSILPYRAVVVDEAQDLSVQAFRLIRQIAGEEHENDLFIVGDSHQRIYRKKVVLSRCGINVRGRSRTLKINYRTTEETRAWANRLLQGVSFDDLDDGVDEGKGYLSLMHGSKPEINCFDTFNEEVDFIEDYLKGLQADGVDPMNVCLVARTQYRLDQYAVQLREDGIKTYEIKRRKAEDRDISGLRLATMHRIKGLEFDYIIMAGINDGVVPLEKALEESGDTVTRQEAETAERSLLYVASTRAKKAAIVTCYGKISRYLKLFTSCEDPSGPVKLR